MDLILFILVIIFMCQKDVKHNYIPIIVLSILAAIISVCLIPSYGFITLLLTALDLTTLTLAIAAPNKEAEEA